MRDNLGSIKCAVAFGAFMLLASAAILCLGPYRYPAEEKTPIGAGRVVDAPATEHA